MLKYLGHSVIPEEQLLILNVLNTDLSH